MKPDLQATPVIPFCNSIAPTAYACSTGQEDKPLPTALKLQQSFLAMIFSLFPKSWRKEFLSLVMPTSCHVLAALSILCTHAAWVLSQSQLCFGPCSSNSIFCKLLREDLILNSLKKSRHTGGSAAWSALKESWRRFCAACVTSQGQGGRAHMADSRPSGTPELSVFVSWHTDPFPGLCTWLPPTRFLNCILMKYNSSAEEPRQSAGKQEEGGTSSSHLSWQGTSSESYTWPAAYLSELLQTTSSCGCQGPGHSGYAMLVKCCCTGPWFRRQKKKKPYTCEC